MKTLQESLFDNDIITSGVRFGELYELSAVSHYNGVTNNIREVLGMFDEKALKKARFPIKVNKDNGFIEYWKMTDSRIDLFVEMLLNMPMQYINKIFENPAMNGKRAIEDYLSKYYSHHGAKAKDIFIGQRKLYDGSIELTIYDNIRLSRPSSIKLTFEKK